MTDQIHPELREAILRFPTLPIHNRLFLQLLKLTSRFVRPPAVGLNVSVDVRQLESTSVRIYRPQQESSGAGLLWIHGGGYVLGSTALDNRICGALARDLGLVVVSVEYRLAPQHPFPAGLNDCFEAWQWLVREAPQFGVDPDRIALGGQSAGGGLAAALAQRVVDTGGIQPAAQMLFCPMLDDRTALRRQFDDIVYPLWPNRSNRRAWSWYIGRPAGSAEVPPYAAPARRQLLEGLPPAWISIGDIELFYEESCRYAERLSAAGVRCKLHITAGAPHGFEFVVPDASPTYHMLQSAYQFLRYALQLPSELNRYSYGAKPDHSNSGSVGTAHSG